MKLLYVYRYCILGGVTTQLANRLRYLRDHCTVHFAFIHDHGGRTALGEDARVAIVEGKQLRALIEAQGFDAVVVIDTPEVYPVIASSSFSGTVVNEVHTTTANLQYLHDLPDGLISAFLAPSEYLVRRIETEFGYGGRVPCYHTPNCLDTDLFQAQEVDASPTKKIVLWVGKLDDHKNWRGFVEAASLLAKRRHDCEFWIVGGETAPDDIARDLVRTVGTQGLFGRLRWLQRVEYEVMPRLYSLVAASGGVLVSTSCDESFGMTVIEALACGCRSITAEVGALPEVLDLTREDWFYPYFDLEDLVNLAERTLDSSVDAETRSAWRQRVMDRYSIERAGAWYYDTLRGVCESSGFRVGSRSGV